MDFLKQNSFFIIFSIIVNCSWHIFVIFWSRITRKLKEDLILRHLSKSKSIFSMKKKSILIIQSINQNNIISLVK